MARLMACPANACAEVKLQVQSSGGYVAKGEASKGVVEALEALLLIRKKHLSCKSPAAGGARI